jgi:hypothetical protein
MPNKLINSLLSGRKSLFGKIRTSAPNHQLEANQYALPDWQSFLAHSTLWRQALTGAVKGRRVLIPTSIGGLSAATILEGMLGVAMTLRGAQVRFLLCDGVLPACLQVHAGKLKQTSVITDYKLKSQVCPGCIARGDAAYKATGLPISYYSDFINETEREDLRDLAYGIPLKEIRKYHQKGVALGEHALAGTLRFFACGHLPETEEAENILRRYFEAALITNLVMGRVLTEHIPEVALFHHGIYVPQGIIGEVCRKRGIRVVNWQVGYRKKCFIFSHQETYHHTLISEPTSNWEDICWNDHLDIETTTYLKSRWHGSNDWIWFHDQPKHEAEAIAKETGIDFSKPTITLLTNVFWDAQLHFKANAFSDMLDWLLKTIEYFKHRPDLQLAIRIHPAEVRGAIPSRQPIVAEIEKAFSELPLNVYLIPPESQVSTYVLCEKSDSVIIFGTKTGVELAAMGIPVVVAGEAWIRNKGITLDATSPDSYFALLDTLPLNKRLSPEETERAKKYAFHFFFRRFVQINFMEPSASGVPYRVDIKDLGDLMPGRDVGLDVVCRGILDGGEFIFPAETYIGVTA